MARKGKKSSSKGRKGRNTRKEPQHYTLYLNKRVWGGLWGGVKVGTLLCLGFAAGRRI